MRNRRRAYWVTAGFLAAFSGCAGDPPSEARLAEWTLAAEPDLRIGLPDGDPNYVFGAVTSAHMLPDGRYLIVDGRNTLLRVFGPDGSFLHAWGRSGQGPEDFGQISGVWIRPPDSIRVFDAANARFASYLMDGSFVGTAPLNTGADGPSRVPQTFIGAFPDGTVALGWIAVARIQRGEVHADQEEVLRFQPDGSFLSVLAAGPGLRRFLGSAGSSPVPFSPVARAVVSGDYLYFTDGSVPEVAVIDRDGAPTRTLSVPAVRTDPGEAWRQLEEELRASDGAQARMWLETFMPGMPRDSVPHVSGLRADDQGFLWVRPYEPLRDALPVTVTNGDGARWWILDGGGGLVATVTIPEELTPLAITGDRVLARHRDALGIQTFAVYRLDRSGMED